MKWMRRAAVLLQQRKNDAARGASHRCDGELRRSWLRDCFIKIENQARHGGPCGELRRINFVRTFGVADRQQFFRGSADQP